MKMYIARDKSGAIWLYENKPYQNDGTFFYNMGWAMALPIKQFPEVTFENSPMEVELKLIEK